LFADDNRKLEVESEAASEEVPTDSTVASWAEKIALSCDWATQGDESELRVKVEFKHLRPDAAAKKADYTFKRGTDGEAIARADAVAFLREALWCAHDIATATFKPNIASRPMPAMFDIALPVKRPVLTNANIQSLQLHRKVCRETHRMPDTGKVALAHLTVPVSKLNRTDYAFKNDATRDDVEADIIKAVRATKASSCQALVFPEYSIPQKLRNRLLEIATDNDVTIIGGFEGSWRECKLANEVFVAIPGEPNLYSQFKHSPSLDEQSPDGMFHDGSLHLFTNSPIGDFAVVVCSDFLETATLDAWSLAGPLPDILFVVARNTYPDLYKHFAITDSFRLYCSVAVCNVLDGKKDDNDKTTSDGTFVVSPRNDDTTTIDVGIDAAVDGTYLKKITVHDIPFSAIRAREHGRSEHGFFAVPRSARRA
jgi:predicted amidohydrolase